MSQLQPERAERHAATERRALVKAAIQSRPAPKVVEKKQHAVSSLEFDAGVLLMYKDADQEERFVRFIHSAPLAVELLLQVIFVIVLTISYVVDRSVWIAFNAGLIFVMALIETYIHIAARGREGDELHKLLRVERLLIVIPTMVGALGTIYRNYSVLHDCSDTIWHPIGSQQMAYSEGHCRYWSNFAVISFAFTAVLQVIRFSVLVGMSVITVLFTATIWLAPSRSPSEEDPAVVVTRMTVLTIAGCAFVCFIRYIDEKQQRRYFEAQEELIHSAKLLSAKRQVTLERFLSVLPEAVSKRLRGGHWKSSQIDVASDATVLVTRIHDYPSWSTSMVPLQVATIVAAMHDRVDRILRTGRLQRVGRLGDTTVAVGNLLERNEGNMAAVTIEAAKRLAAPRNDTMRQESQVPTLLAAVHIGSVEGVLQGAHYVRYEARGPAVDATRSGVLMCDNDRRLLASAAITAVAHDSVSLPQALPLVVDLTGEEEVAFHALSPSEEISDSQEPTAELLGFGLEPVRAVTMDADDDGAFVIAVSKLLGQQTVSFPETKSMLSSSSLNCSSDSITGASSLQELRKESSDPLEIVTDKLGFYRFVDDAAEKEFRNKRMRTLPMEAAKVWLGYAAFVSVIFVMLVADLMGPYAVFGAVLLVLAVLGSACLAVVPSALTDERMSEVHSPWTAAGLFVPLLTVFGCALSRPSVVGLDIKAYVVFGAFMRSYCFNDARLQAIGVPLFSLIATLQYLVPGAHDTPQNIPLIWIMILAAVIAARNREGNELKNYRRGAIAEAVVQQIEEVSRVQRGLLRSSIPQSVFEAAVAARFQGARGVKQANAVVMVARAEAPRHNRRGGLGLVLDQMKSKHLSIAGVLGDDAVIVGPVPTSDKELKSSATETSLREGLKLGLAITEASTNRDAPALSVLVDYDAVAHLMDLGPQPSYSLLGVSATRLICISADVSGMVRGLLVTDRVTAMMKASAMLDDVVVEAQAPMSVRGQGVLRWNRIRKA